MSPRRITLALALALVLVLGLAAAPVAAARGVAPVYYLSLGDSIAAGWQPDPHTGAAGFTNQGYADQLYRKMQGAIPGLQHQKMGCPGETTASMISGGGPAAALCGYTGTSQLNAALAFLAAHQGEVAFITIDIGVNDVLSCLPAPDVTGCVLATLPQVGARLAQILQTLRAATGNTVAIFGMNYYNPYLAAWHEGIPPDGAAGPYYAGLTSQLAMSLNDLTLEPVYAAFGVPVADVWAAFGSARSQTTFGQPFNVYRICQLTWMCYGNPPFANIHPNRKGHAVIAGTLYQIIKGYPLG